MTKRKKKKLDPVEDAQQKMAKAQLDLLIAQEKRTNAIARGEREVQEAQEKAVRRERKATERVERRAGALTRAEAWLHSVTNSGNGHVTTGRIERDR
jgi:hypothetical protein